MISQAKLTNTLHNLGAQVGAIRNELTTSHSIHIDPPITRGLGGKPNSCYRNFLYSTTRSIGST